jgi:arylsulfatase
MFGKHHNVPPGEGSPAGPFDNWPTGLGFEYFYGFVTADTDQWDTNVYRGTNRLDPDEGHGALLDKRLASDAITWLHNQAAAAPDKPFFIYFAPGSTHVPHQALPEYIARFKGRFDQGWDKIREETWQRQLAAGIIPKGTKLTPRPPQIPAWDNLPAAQKAFFARTMEVAAAQLTYQDEQFGRVLDELQRMGKLDNTLIVSIEGDNGASLEAGPNGTINETRSMTGGQERPEWLLANTDKLGGHMTYENYPIGWAWAMDTPLRWGKMYVSMLGAVRNGMAITWKGHVAHPGAICSEFGHLIDVAPTILEAAHLSAPTSVYGVSQKPMDGQSLLPSLSSCDASHPRTQYFEINGKIGLYYDGWFLSGDDERMIWENLPPDGPRPQTEWTLYDLTRDFSQSEDLAAKYPARVQELIALWRREADRNHVFPLDHRFGAARFDGAPRASGPDRYDYWGTDVSVPTSGAPGWTGRSFTLEADLVSAKSDPSGVVMAVGSHFGGWSLFLDKGRPTLVYAASTDPNDIVRIEADDALAPGAGKLRMRFAFQSFDKGADVSLFVGDKSVASGHIANLFVSPSGLGETVDIGRDIGVPVTDYASVHGVFEGDVPHVSVIFDTAAR